MQVMAEPLVELEAKATLYSLLAKAMNYPDQQLVDSIASSEFTEALADTLKTLGHNQLGQEIRALGQDERKKEQNLLLDLEKDYTWMFFASKPRLAYLFESVYREGKLLQESTFEIAGLYRDAGLVLNEDFRLPPDHIAVELEFLSFLFFKELEGHKQKKPEAVEYARELQAAVIDRHLRCFAQNLAGQVRQHSKSPFYKAVALVLANLFSQPMPA